MHDTDEEIHPESASCTRPDTENNVATFYAVHARTRKKNDITITITITIYSRGKLARLQPYLFNRGVEMRGDSISQSSRAQGLTARGSSFQRPYSGVASGLYHSIANVNLVIQWEQLRT